MNKILILSNDSEYTYNFRKELINKLVSNNFQVNIATNFTEKINELKNMNVKLFETHIDRRGMNPFKDIKLLMFYSMLIKQIRPDIVLSYTIKPNIYGGLASRFNKVKFIPTITGLGTAIENRGILRLITIRMYKSAMKNAKATMFQNEKNMRFMEKAKIGKKPYMLLPGSGVNIDDFNYLNYPDEEYLNFMFIGRVMRDKGIDYYLETAKSIIDNHPKAKFHILGSYEEDYKGILTDLEKQGYIKYHGKVDDIRDYLKIASAIIHPTFHEGMSNVLLEAASSGRPIIASNIPGCKEIIDEGVNGFTFEVKNQSSLTTIVEKFINLSYEDKKNMGFKGREKIVQEFNREKVVNIYMNVIKKIMEDKQ